MFQRREVMTTFHILHPDTRTPFCGAPRTNQDINVRTIPMACGRYVPCAECIRRRDHRKGRLNKGRRSWAQQPYPR